jgi:hypothetical protein
MFVVPHVRNYSNDEIVNLPNQWLIDRFLDFWSNLYFDFKLLQTSKGNCGINVTRYTV